MGSLLGTKGPIHPNDHVNMGQSSNDVIPRATHIAAMLAVDQELLPALQELEKALVRKAKQFDSIVKTGRTHLIDATPIRLGQEFGRYASQINHGIRRVQNARPFLSELAIGGTAVGTGINAHPDLAQKIVDKVSAATKVRFRVAESPFEAQGAQDALIEASAAVGGSQSA